MPCNLFPNPVVPPREKFFLKKVKTQFNIKLYINDFILQAK